MEIKIKEEKFKEEDKFKEKEEKEEKEDKIKEEKSKSDLSLFWEKLIKNKSKNKNKNKNKNNLIIVIGILGMVLILLSEFIPKDNKQKDSREKEKEMLENSVLSEEEENSMYIKQMEARLKALTENIEGVGSCEVMVTLKQGTQYIYASENKITKDNTRDSTNEYGQKVQQKDDTQSSIVLLDDTSGGSKPLIERKIEPEINGVAVVCQGAASAVVRERVTSTVTTVLGIRSNQVCVTPKSKSLN